MIDEEKTRSDFAELVYKHGLNSIACKEILENPVYARAIQPDLEQYVRLDGERRFINRIRVFRTLIWVVALIPLGGIVTLTVQQASRVASLDRARKTAEAELILAHNQLKECKAELVSGSDSLAEMNAKLAVAEQASSTASDTVTKVRNEAAKLEHENVNLRNELALLQSESEKLEKITFQYLVDPILLGYAGEHVIDRVLMATPGARESLTNLMESVESLKGLPLSSEEHLARANLYRALDTRDTKDTKDEHIKAMFDAHLSAAAKEDYQVYVLSDLAKLQIVALADDGQKSTQAITDLCQKVKGLKDRAMTTSGLSKGNADPCLHYRFYLAGRQALWNLKMLDKEDACITEILKEPIPEMSHHSGK